ncbi:MAG TPA: sulfite exporter TauE/SafE family protein [Vicinamibacterales bacterium]|nr:sulfite exporter TauE/SafE family protein [Vicinamibacterales bacterium]
MNPISALLATLAALGAGFGVTWTRAALAARRRPGPIASPALDARTPTALHTGIGLVTNFFDSLGIGSFATTTAMFRFWRMVPDRVIPGTLNVGHTAPVIVQAFIFTAIIPVDVVTLFSMIAASVAGAWFGAGIVARWPRRKVQIGMGSALLVAAALMMMTQLGLVPGGGEALGVRGVKLAIGIAGNAALGALMTLGIGLYAPCMILVSLLGMNPRAAFPLMMGSCAFLMPVGSLRFIREESYSLRAALGLTLGGIPGVLLGAYVVRELPLYAVRWLVIVVVVYTAAGLLMSAFRSEEAEAPLPANAYEPG